jgi:hypothetical protein
VSGDFFWVLGYDLPWETFSIILLDFGLVSTFLGLFWILLSLAIAYKIMLSVLTERRFLGAFRDGDSAAFLIGCSRLVN